MLASDMMEGLSEGESLNLEGKDIRFLDDNWLI